jgi:predicted CoA-binding protein
MTPEERARTIAYLDLTEGRGRVPMLDDAGIAAHLSTTRRIAVIGASDDPGRPSHDVFRHLLASGFDCVPVNPNATAVAGVTAFPALADAVAATGRFDIVDVFRRPEHCAGHAREAVAAGARCLWLQLGVVDWEAAGIAHDGGLAVVMDRCLWVEWRRHGHARPAEGT